ncbi:MAG TPA: VOC family protein [Bacteroidetes bacterium]|nr:VOC family protein [Bacteroidota bacterium]
MNLNQVTIPTADMLVSLPFYERLGLQLIVDSRPRYARFLLPAGGATLSLHHSDTLASGPGVQVYFECEDLDEKVAALQVAGIVFDTLPVDQQWLWREAWLTDPDGHQICLFWGGENRANPPWRIR